ncbi:MAG: PDZ domain-containing protein [Bacteroidales bacterium]|nr:PDZ domain-containing protein [Bacteroidales bacterium]
MKPQTKDLLRTIGWWVILMLLLALLIGMWQRNKRKEIEITKGDWAKLMLVLESVDRDYVDAIDQKAVTEQILPDILAKLDPHSLYLPPVEMEAAEQDLQGGFDGIGIQFNVPNDTAVVTHVIAGGPSEKAGLLSGDRIIQVDDRVIAGTQTPQDTMVRLMKGKRGTKVMIQVKREGVPDLIQFPITRGVIPVNSVDVAFMLNDTTGYIKLSKFAKSTYLEFLKAALGLRDQGMRRLVFDLRDNTGGYLDQALMLSNEFLEKGDLIVYMEGRNRPRSDVFADGKGSCRDIALDVLINEGSASSSEIFAGAMQDNDRATLYGLRSFGKGLVQEPLFFSDGSGIRLTVARYHTPSGRCIQKPYGEDYGYDIYERYLHGEMMSVDSIKVNDTLKFETRSGRTVYGGGGIIPDVFVPLDTTRYTEFLGKCNRQSLQVKYANQVADRHRAALREIRDLPTLNRFLDGIDLKGGFLAYAASQGVVPAPGEWAVSGDMILVQVRALVGRNTPMNDDAFYPIYLTIDNVIDAVMKKE